MKFVDLFAGLGGFHVGLSNNGHECVFACEIDQALRALYEVNHGILPHDDIQTLDKVDVPEHDILCAGFPCQPFSLAGKKRGAKCPESGRLIDHVVRIAKYHQPKFIFLENVPNILTIANGVFWEYIKNSFSTIGYNIEYRVISPVDVGIPQNRKRVFIVANRHDVDIKDFKWPVDGDLKGIGRSLSELLEKNAGSKRLEPRKLSQLKAWQNLLDNLKLPSLGSISIAAPEFGASYPEDFSQMTLKGMEQFSGAYGRSLKNCKTWEELLLRMPSYVRKQRKVPQWIRGSVKFSRELYQVNKTFCNSWVNSLDKENNSWQILEWRGKSSKLEINEHLVQFRASGIRILKPDVAPSLIAI